MMTTRVALTMRVTQASGYIEPRDSISHDWLARLGEWDMTPLLVPNHLSAPESYLDGLDADLLVLTGGDDLGITPERDRSEIKLLEHALHKGIAVLGVCRGMQLINVHLGGRLVPVDGHVTRPHAVSVGILWQDHYKAETMVNSFHAQAVPADGLAPGLVAAAHDGEGNVEALFHQTLPMAAIMWHAERPGAPPGDRKLLESLIGGLSPP
jgi:N5-(cytidine 5'-diphosphoramidyl)-L-glutamine hydrolase